MDSEKVLRGILIIIVLVVVISSFIFIYFENKDYSMSKQEALQIAIHSEICSELNLTKTAYQDPSTNSWWIYPKNKTNSCNYYCVIEFPSKRAVIKQKCEELL